MPPPVTTKSYSPAGSGCSGSPRQARRKAAISGSAFGGVKSGSRVRTIASQRPSKPVRSCKREPHRALRQSHRAAVLPVPLGAHRAEGGGQGLSIDQHLEPARRARRLPPRHPVLGAHPHPVAARRRGSRPSSCASATGTPEPVGQQVGRAHVVHELRVDHPAADVGEPLGFDENRVISSAGGEAMEDTKNDGQ